MSTAATAVPFVIGQWVCGPRFYGREAEIAGLLGSQQRWLWMAGLRRIGKTSLLKQIDHLASLDAGSRQTRAPADPHPRPLSQGRGEQNEDIPCCSPLSLGRGAGGEGSRTLPLFWDLQGVGGVEELGLTFTDALLDAEELLAGQGISLEEVEDGDVFASLEKLARVLRRRGSGLLLLCDEADELMPLHRAVPGLVARLWQAVAGFEPARVVLASSLRLCDVAAAERGIEELVERFAAPRILGVMTDDEARSLLRQSQLPAAARPPFEEVAVEAIRDRCGNHPMLLQIVAKRYQEVGDLPEAFLQVEADRTVQHLLAVDFDLLLPEERQILRSLAGSPENAIVDPAGARRLFDLGLVRHGGPRGLTIPNRFLESWLR